MSLLDDAKKVKIRGGFTKIPSDEELQLVFAWLNDEVTTKQVWKALHKNNPKISFSGNILYRVATIIKYNYITKKIKITKN